MTVTRKARSKKRAFADEFDGFADDLLRERHARPLIIVAAARVDLLLLAILDGFLLPKRAPGKERDELLEGDRPLATFSARIKLCYRLGLVDKALSDALEDLRALRNPSAHNVAFDVTQSPLREHLNRLRGRVTLRGAFTLTKARYFTDSTLSSHEELQCALLTLCALLEAIREKIRRTSGQRSALAISKR